MMTMMMVMMMMMKDDDDDSDQDAGGGLEDARVKMVPKPCTLPHNPAPFTIVYNRTPQGSVQSRTRYLCSIIHCWTLWNTIAIQIKYCAMLQFKSIHWAVQLLPVSAEKCKKCNPTLFIPSNSTQLMHCNTIFRNTMRQYDEVYCILKCVLIWYSLQCLGVDKYWKVNGT